MINRMTHVCIYVLDQESARNFYVNILGFKVHTDAPLGPRITWLTVCPPEQPDLELNLMPVVDKGVMFNPETAATMRDLIKAGTFGFGVLECHDLMATYEELKAKGVVFTKPPKKEFYGYEALVKDD